MKDGLGKDLELGQRVAVPCNSRFKVGILANYKANNGKRYREMAEFVANPVIEDDEYGGNWRMRYYTQERVDAQAFLYYVRFPDGKVRKFYEAASILGLTNEPEVVE